MGNECSSNKEQCHEGSTQAHCSTGPSHQGEQECNMHEKLLCLADEAWKEVLKEKIKQEIEKTSGAKLSALAKLVAETNGRKWAFMIQAKKGCEDYKTQVRTLLGSFAE